VPFSSLFKKVYTPNPKIVAFLLFFRLKSHET
jgi:hypothetical protein